MIRDMRHSKLQVGGVVVSVICLKSSPSRCNERLFDLFILRLLQRHQTTRENAQSFLSRIGVARSEKDVENVEIVDKRELRSGT